MSRSKGKGKKTAVATEDEQERLVEMWKMKHLIKQLREARGNGTSMISLIIPPGDVISRVSTMLQNEYGTASNIKSRVNRLSVLSAITSARERLKKYSKTPPNGLVVFVGTVVTAEGKEKKMSIHFEPFKPINTSLYLCDNKFHVEALEELLTTDETFGFVIMDGHGCLFGTLSGSTVRVLQKFNVELPKKHGRGGQSAARFGRLRMEKRQNYVRKCAEACYQHFLPGHERPNVQGLVLAGCASFKHDLHDSDVFDPRLREIVIKTIDTSYGGEIGLNQAIEMSRDALADVKFVREKALLSSFMEEIAKETDRYCYGVRDMLRALDMGAVDTLIVWENLSHIRFELRHPVSGETKVDVVSPEAAEDGDFLSDEDGTVWDTLSQTEFLQWLAEHYKDHGATLEFVSDRSSEGAQFVKGFGGVGGLLRYKIDFAELDGYMCQGESDDDDAWI